MGKDSTLPVKTGRRNYLKAASALGLAGLAGCMGDNGGSGDFPGDDSIRWIIPYGTGGGFDTYTRGVGEFVPDHFEEGDPEIEYDNVTGAGGATGAAELYNADPDGYTIATLNMQGQTIQQLIQDNVAFDMLEMEPLGVLAAGPYGIATGADSDYNSIEDLEGSSTQVGTSGITELASIAAMIVADEGGMDIEFVTGYDGVPELTQSLIQGETDWVIRPLENWRDSVNDGDLEILLAWADDRESLPADYPGADDLEITGDYDTYAPLTDLLTLNRMVVAPPDTDEDRVETLADAVYSAATSDEAIEWGEEANFPMDGTANREDTIEMLESVEGDFSGYLDLIEGYIEDQ